jgi:hypothetical protein
MIPIARCFEWQRQARLANGLADEEEPMIEGFIKLQRNAETFELLRDTNAFVLLTVIALRARRTDDFNIDNLQPGEALVGDHRRYGMSERQYRSAKQRLKRWGFADFKPTNKGTIATLLDTRVYDINEAPSRQARDDQMPECRRVHGGQTTTNKKDKKAKNEKKYSVNSAEFTLSALLLSLILERKPDLRRPNLQTWAVPLDRMLRLDGRRPERIEAVLRWCQKDPFWQNNILSTDKLRNHFDRLELQMQQQTPKESTRDMVARMEREGKL